MPHSQSDLIVSPSRSSRRNAIACQSRKAIRTPRILGLQRQAGISMFGWLCVLCAVAFGLSIAMKIVPHYMDHNSIVAVIDGMSPELWRGTNKKRMHEAVDKGLKVNNIRSVKSADVLKIDRNQMVTKLALDYEIRENLFGNIDVVMVFKKDYQF